MKRIALHGMKIIPVLILSLLPSSLVAQDIAGAWNGILAVQGTQLRLVFHIEETDSGYVTTLDSPDQGASGVSIARTTFTAQVLELAMPNISAAYEGTLAGDSIRGTWLQGLTTYPLVLTREDARPTVLRRPQEPEPPYPYRADEVFIRNVEADVTLAGTITIPAGAGPHPAVMLISGSGPQNRNEEIFGHKPFLVLADHLTRRGIVVLRYDDRGIGESTGSFETATSEDFARDAAAAVRYLAARPEVDARNIGLVGHSEGALVAGIVAARFADVAHLVLLAGIGVPGSAVSLMQSKVLRPFEVPNEDAFERFTRTAIRIASSATDLAAGTAELTRHYETVRSTLESMLPNSVEVDDFIAQQVASMMRPWSRYFLSYDPGPDLERIDVPVLSLNGSTDVQVPARINQQGIREALQAGGNRHHVIRELPGLNHMFQESESGAMAEYSRIEQTFSPIVMNEIATWILDEAK